MLLLNCAHAHNSLPRCRGARRLHVVLCPNPAPQHPALALKPAKTAAPNAIAGTPTIIFFNGMIYTGEGFAEDKPQIVEAMAIGGGKVLAVGTTEEITRLAGPKTRPPRSRLRAVPAPSSFPDSTTRTRTSAARAAPSSMST